ncbi:MAG: LEA type 2 family protein [Deltaproteobacteria bacterium]|nr:LEA type 2 family protein [Deltaproteobacteria bacterium]
MVRKPDRKLVLLLLGTLLLVGCGVRQLARGEIEPPRVHLQGVVPGLPTREGWPLTCILAVENPNRQPLDLRGYDYQLWLEGKSVAQGASRQRLYLPPGGQAEVEFPVVVRLPAVLSLTPAALSGRPLHYRLSGGFRLASVLGGLIRIPFRFEGETTLEEGRELLRLYGQ